MAAGPWLVYNDALANAWKKRLDLNGGDTIKIALVTSASNAINKALVGATYSALTNEVANANGYTTGGVAAGSPTITGGGATATITWDTADVSWTASGGNIVFRAAVAYDVTTGYLIAYCLGDSTPADVTVVNGTTETISITNIFSEA